MNIVHAFHFSWLHTSAVGRVCAFLNNGAECYLKRFSLFMGRAGLFDRNKRDTDCRSIWHLLPLILKTRTLITG